MPDVIILDTHIWIWFINQEFDRFPSAWREAIDRNIQLASVDRLFTQYLELGSLLMTDT